MSEPVPLAEFNTDDPTARRVLGECLDIPGWIDAVLVGRPYASVEALRRRASEAFAAVTWDAVAGALARHPRIGEKATGSARDRAMSAPEQAGVRTDQLDDLAAGNAAYERRFGHIFLICAAGLTGGQMLAALRQRMTNDPETEHSVVISELRRIAALRLARAVTA